MSNDLTVDQFKKALPKKTKPHVTQENMDAINSIISDPEIREAYRDNLMAYTNVMSEGRFRLSNYIEAVQYVTYKLLGDTNMVAWCKVFPDKYQDLLDKGTQEKHIASIVSAYNKGILVNKIFEQTLVPTHVLNADLHQKAINHLAYLMINAKSEKVQSDSASKLVDALKLPETQQVELNIGIKEDNSIEELRATTLELVKQQRAMIEAGAKNAKEIAHSKLHVIDAEVINE